MMGILSPLANRIAKAFPTLDWGIDYGSTPNNGTVMMGDFIPCPSTKLYEFRISGGIAETLGKPPSSIYMVNATIGRRNRFTGAAFGSEHIHERENDRSLLIELNGRIDAIHTPEVAQMEFEAMVRNFIDLVEEGDRRMLRSPRKGIRRESSAGYFLFSRAGGAPEWEAHNSLDEVLSQEFRAPLYSLYGQYAAPALVNTGATGREGRSQIPNGNCPRCRTGIH